MIMKSFLQLSFSLLSLVWFINSASAQLTLEDCQAKARANYPLIKQLDLIQKTTEYNLSNANKAYLPQISLTAIEGYLISGLPAFIPGAPTENGTFKFIGLGQLSQTIWDGGATKSQKNYIQSNTEVEKSSVEISLYAIRERVNQLYFGILLVNEQLNQIKLLRENLERNLSKVKQAAENGLGYNSDADEVRVEILKIDQKSDEFQFARKSYLGMLSLMIGEPLSDEVQLQRPLLEEVPSSPNINRPELTLYNYQRQLTQVQNQQSKAAYMPKIGLLAFGVRLSPGASLGAGSLESLSIAGASLSWNTMGLYRDRNNRELAKIQMDRIQNQQETFLFNTNVQLTQFQHEIEKQKSILSKDSEIMKLRSSIRKAYELKYQNGVCTVNDLVGAVNAESDAASNLALHEIQLLLSVYNFKNTSGN